MTTLLSQYSSSLQRIAFCLLLALGLAAPASAQRLVRERLLSGLRQAPLNVYRVQVTPNNNLLVQGLSMLSTPGNNCNPTLNDNYLLSPQLDTVWTQRGPALNSGWTDMTWTGHSDFMIFGDQQYAPTGSTQCTGRNFFLGRYAASTSSPRWTQAFNLGTRLNRVGKLAAAADGGFLMSGSSSGSGVRQTWQLVKTDSLGRLQWVKNYGISFSEVPFLLQTSYRNKNCVLMAGTGQYGAPYNIMKLRLLLVNQQGDSLRNALIAPLSPVWGISSVSNHITPLRDGGYLIPAQADSLDNATGMLITTPIMLKVDSLLRLQWYHLQRTPAAQRVQYGGKMCELNDGTLLALVTAQNSTTASSRFEMHRINGTTGQLMAVYPFTSTVCQDVSSYDLVPSSDGHTLYVGGSCFGTTGSQGYVAVLDLQSLPAVVTPLAAATAKDETTFTLSPNPAHGSATLTWQLPTGQRAGRLRLYTALGQIAREVKLPAGTSGTFDVSGLAAGTYLVRLFDTNGAALGRAQRQVVLP
jgi:hypothetical protein